MTDEKKEITLKYRPSMMTLNDMCNLEQPSSYNALRDLLAKHFINGTGEWIDDIEAAKLAVGNASKGEIKHLLSDLWGQINNYGNDDPN